MTDTPEFSVVLPTHSRPQFLTEAIDSVLQQTIRDFELIVVDDASEPAASVPDDPRVRLVRMEANGGAARARNAGIDASVGKVLVFLDDDDVYTPRRLEFARRGLRDAPVTICWSHYIGQPVHGNRVLEGDVSHVILDRLTPSLGVTAVRRESMVRFDERWQAVEDVDWWVRATETLRVSTVPELGMAVRQHDGPRGLNATPVRVEENFDLLRAHQHYFNRHRRAAAFRLKRAGLLALQVGDARSARRAFSRSLITHPQASTAWHLARACRPSSTSEPTR